MEGNGSEGEIALRPTGVGRGRVFISHAARDAQTADALRRSLRDTGFQVFDALTDIEVGDDIMGALTQAISDADYCIFLVGGGSSSWMESEQSLAVGRAISGGDVKVLPVLLRHSSEVPFLLRNFQGLRIDGSDDVDKIVRALLTVADAPSRPPLDTEVLEESVRLRKSAIQQERVWEQVERWQRTADLVRVVMTAVVFIGAALLVVALAVVGFSSGHQNDAATSAVVATAATSTFAALLSTVRYRAVRRELGRTRHRIVELEDRLIDNEGRQ